MILKPKKIKFVTPPIVSPLICHEVMESDAMTLVFFPHSSFNKESTCSVGDLGSIPGAGRSPGEGIGYPLQYNWASLVAQLVKNPPTMRETWV